ncbi:MAG TPA: hypothetical protein VJ904_14585, partial [Tichowtungia sp.]|nr:hypothetical protein [Tichowtungia sp.]
MKSIIKRFSTAMILASMGLVVQSGAAALYETGFTDLSGWTTEIDPQGVLEVSTFASPGESVASYRQNDDGFANIMNSITRTIDTTGYTNLMVSLSAFQNAGSFEGDEYLEIEVDYGEGFVSLLKNTGVWNGTPGGSSGTGNSASTSTGGLQLDAAADNGSFDIRITMASGWFSKVGGTIESYSEVYYLDHLRVEEFVAPAPDKRVKISGIYPHLALSNNESGEVGVGAVVPWADRLWIMTYT